MKFAIALSLLLATLITQSAFGASKIKNPIFYKAEKNGHIAYFLGTVHFRVKPAEIPDAVWKALNASQTVMVELNMTAEAQASGVEKIVPEDKKLGRLLPEKQFRFLYSLVQQNFGDMIDIAALAQMDVVTGVYMSQIKMQDIEAQMKNDTLDQQVALRAAKANKPLVELDKIAKRDDTTVISKEDLVKTIDEMIPKGAVAASAEINAGIDKTVSDYRAGVCSQDPEEAKKEAGTASHQSMIVDRNSSWVKTIDQTMATSTAPIFIAAGCMHFNEQDPDSVLNSMKALGYKVTRLKPK